MQKRLRKSGAELGMVSVMLAASSISVQADNQTLSVATNADFPPYEYCEEQEIVGIDMEIAGLIADELGRELEICNMSFDEMLDAVLSGKTDIAMGRIVEPQEESEELLFSNGYLEITYVVLVPEESLIETKEDLDGKTTGTVDQMNGKTLAEELSGNDAVVYEKEETALEDLRKGTLDALILDEKSAQYFCNQMENLRIADHISDQQKFVIAARAEQEDMLTEINDALATMEETGEMDKIVEKYLGEEKHDEETEAES